MKVKSSWKVEGEELDDEAIDGLFAMVEKVPEGDNAEQHAAF